VAAKRKAAKPSAREQKEQEAFDGLRALLVEAGYDVHVSKSLDGKGGDCLVKGSKRVIVSRRTPLNERVEMLLDIVRREDVAPGGLPPPLAELVGRITA
jgi:hypothetical protein